MLNCIGQVLLTFNELLQETIINHAGLHDSKRETIYNFIKALSACSQKSGSSEGQRSTALAVRTGHLIFQTLIFPS